MKPYFHLQEDSNRGESSWDAFFGITLTSCPALRTRGAGEEEDAARRIAQQVDFISTLHNTEPPRTYALRYISTPNQEAFLAGTVDVCLLVKVSARSPSSAEKLSEYLFQEMAVILGSMLPDYSWWVLESEETFLRMWSPFDLSSAYVAEIRRREAILQVGSIMRRPSLLGRSDAGRGGPRTREIYFVHQFIPRSMAFARMLRSMLLYPNPLVLQVSLAPTFLEQSEEDKLISYINECERYLGRVHSVNAMDTHQSMSQQHATKISKLLGEQLDRLRDAPFMMNISLASPEPLQRHIVETLGVEVTMPVGGLIAGSPQATLAQKGGYDIAYPKNDDELQAAQSNVARLEFNRWGDSEAPEALVRLRNLVDANEAVSAFRFPLAGSEGLVGMESQVSRLQPVPKEVVDLVINKRNDTIMLGENRYLGFPTYVYMLNKDRHQHVYVVGQTGTGKTTLLKTMIISDMNMGHGLAVIDPHGDLFEEILAYIPEERLDDMVIFDPSDDQYPVGFNILEVKNREEKYFIVREMKATMERLISDQYGGKGFADFAGPLFFQYLQNGMLLVMSNPARPGTIIDFYNLFMVPDYYQQWLPLAEKDSKLEAFVDILKDLSPQITSRPRPGEISLGEYIASKFEDFVFDTRLRCIFGQRKSTVDFGDIISKRKILLVNLAKGLLAEANSRFLGMLIMAKLQAEAMKRVKIPAGQRSPFFIYIDEFQSLTTSNFTMLLSEGRKFGIGLVMANQFVHQIPDETVKQAIFGNVGTIVSFRVGQTDGDLLEPHMRPYFDAYDLTNLPNWNACVKMSVNGQMVRPFSLHTVLPKKELNPAITARARELSREKYGRKREEVEMEIEI